MMQAGDATLTPGHVPAAGSSRAWFVRFAAFTLGYTLLVIMFGAWVRISGSGAGCGDHWPTCHGELTLRSPTAQTLIEYTHRVTSGALGILALVLPLWAWRSFAPGHPARRYSWLTLVLVCVEAAIGAGLVLRQLVASDASVARALAVALHLGNTLLLTASAALTVATARAGASSRAAARFEGRLGGGLLAALLGALMLVSMTGAVTALGDTLFPVRSVGTGWTAPPPDHFLVQLRVLHPVLAGLCVCFAVFVSRRFAEHSVTRPWALLVGALSGAQLLLGGVNIVLNAPGWLQLLHLLLAQLLWISVVLLAWTVRRARRAQLA